MKKIYAEPMTKVMKLNVASIMDDTLPASQGEPNPQPGDGALDLF